MPTVRYILDDIVDLRGRKFGRATVKAMCGRDCWKLECDYCGERQVLPAAELYLNQHDPRFGCWCTPPQFVPGAAKATVLRSSPDWALAVKLRDRLECQTCQFTTSSTTVMHAHHLNSRTRFPEQAAVIANGVTLCIPCHLSFHSLYGYLATKEQFEEFQLNYWALAPVCTTVSEGQAVSNGTLRFPPQVGPRAVARTSKRTQP